MKDKVKGNIIMKRWWATNKSEELLVIAWKEIVPPEIDK